MGNDKLIVGLTGMPGAGKTVFVQAALAEEYEVVVMGDIIREETAKRGLVLNPANVGKVMLELRAEFGEGVIAEKCVPKIEGKAGKKILVDGIRSLREVDVFKSRFPSFLLLAVHSAPADRYRRLSSRGRSDDPKSWQVFNERDMRELSVGLGNAIAMSEYIIMNDDTLEALESQVTELLRKVEKKWMN